MGGDEAVVVADVVHPTLAARAGGFAPAQEKLAIEPTSGRRRSNFHGAIDLAAGQTQMIEALSIDAASTIRLLRIDRGALSDAWAHPCLSRQCAHASPPNHSPGVVREWLARPGRRTFERAC